MTPAWKWLLGILIALVLLSVLAMPIMMSQFYPYGGYGMMSGRGASGWHMPMHYGYSGWSPMMGGGYGPMGIGMLLSVLIQLGLLVLIVLSIIWLVRALGRQAPKGG